MGFTIVVVSLMKRKILVVPYNPTWVSEFETEGKRISLALGEIVARLHHIGSTAIPGIYAKPIIDFLMEVYEIVELDDRSSALEGLGYEAKGEFGIPGRRYFRKNDASAVRTHQIHAYEVGSSEIERHLAFRDYMSVHAAEALAYSELKQSLAIQHPTDIQAYMDGKDAFIKEHLAKAISWRSSQNTIGPK